MKVELIKNDAISLGEMVRDGEIKPSELVKMAIERIEYVNPKLNAVIHKMYDGARKKAERMDKEIASGKKPGSKLYGVPFLLKDLLAEYEGAPYNEGSAALKGYISNHDTELVKRHKAAGLIVVGKTNTPEFGLTSTTEPLLHGASRNPWNQELSTGGSSGGSAVAVATGIVPMAHGNDGGGSIRIPSSCCGLFGLKPTRARNPMGPSFGDLFGGMAIEHALTRTVRDSAALLDVTSGPSIGDPYYAPPKKRPFLEEVGQDTGKLNIGFLSSIPPGWNFGTKIDPECEKAVRDAAHLCESLGHNIEEINPDLLNYPDLFMTFGTVWACGCGQILHYWEKVLDKKITEDQVEPMTWIVNNNARNRTGADYLSSIEECQLFSRKMAQWFHKGGYDLLLTPTLAVPPPKLGSISAKKVSRTIKLMNNMTTFTYVYNITGQPAMSVPLYWTSENIPIGVEFASPFGDEATLFRLAAQLEQERPWIDKKPPIHCSNM